MVAKRPARSAPRLKDIPDEQMSAPQRALRDAIFAGPRGKRSKLTGPFAIWLHAPEYGNFAQALGAHCRFKTAVEPRLSEFAILVTAHSGRRNTNGMHMRRSPSAPASSRKQSADLRAGRAPKSAPKDERAIYDFIKELYRTRRVSNKTYARVHALLGDAATVELVGILGYYTLISMTLNVFRAPLPDDAPLPFREPAG